MGLFEISLVLTLGQFKEPEKVKYYAKKIYLWTFLTNFSILRNIHTLKALFEPFKVLKKV